MCELHQLGHAVGTEPSHRILAMLAHRQRTDAQLPGDFLAGQSVADQAHDLDLARPQLASPCRKTAEGISTRAEAIACAVSCAVVLRLSLRRMLARCLRTVNSDIRSAAAMRLQFIVLPISASTSFSLTVRRDIHDMPAIRTVRHIQSVHNEYMQSIVDIRLNGAGAPVWRTIGESPQAATLFRPRQAETRRNYTSLDITNPTR